MSQSQQSVAMDESQIIDNVDKETNYAEIVESYMKDKATADLVIQRLHMLQDLKEFEEETLDCLKENCRELESYNERIKSSVSQNSMLVQAWLQCVSESFDSQIETKLKLLKELEEEEIKLYEDQIKRLEELNTKYVLLKDDLEPKKLQIILNDLCDQESKINKKIEEAKATLIKLEELERMSFDGLDLKPLQIVCEKLVAEEPLRKERMQLLQAQKENDDEYIKKLQAAIEEFPQKDILSPAEEKQY